jgi:hypothetical protein
MEPFQQVVKIGWIYVKGVKKNRTAPLFHIIIGCHDTAQPAAAFPYHINQCLNDA